MVEGPRIKRREVWLTLPPEYEGFEIKVWLNAPTRIWAALDTGDETEIREALGQLVLEHNGWIDFEGKIYPPADTSQFWQEIPTELAACVITLAQAEMQRLPNSLAPQRRRSKRG